MFKLDHFPDNAPRFPDRIAICAPKGLRAEVKRAADAEQLSPAEFLRRAIARSVTNVLGPNNPDQPRSSVRLVA